MGHWQLLFSHGSPKPEQVRQGTPYLVELLGLLPNLRAVVMLGGVAQGVSDVFRLNCPNVKAIKAPHPSGRNWPQTKMRQAIYEAMKAAAEVVQPDKPAVALGRFQRAPKPE